MCPPHKKQRVWGAKCNMRTIKHKGQIVCPFTSRVLGQGDVNSAGIRNFGTTTRRPVSSGARTCTDWSPQPSQSEPPGHTLPEFMGVVRKLLHGEVRENLTKLTPQAQD